MKTLTKTESIRQRILAGGEGFWNHQDLADYPPATIAKTFTQLVKEGILQRISKGHYYHPRPTRFGNSQPVRSELPYQLTQTRVYPAGVNAANLLGFTTQNAIDGTFATTASSLPTAWLGQRAKLFTRRPSTWENLAATEAALLDFLRSRGEWSDLSPAETNQQLLNHFRVPGRFDRLVAIAHAEPPRVRAMLGAIGQELKHSKDLLQQLRTGLNPYSRFEFGKLSSLWYAQEWQAK
jgi:hypothetical protein